MPRPALTATFHLSTSDTLLTNLLRPSGSIQQTTVQAFFQAALCACVEGMRIQLIACGNVRIL